MFSYYDILSPLIRSCNVHFSGIMIGNTDTKHYQNFTRNIYRFSPTFMYPPDLKRFHGDNERISIKNYEQAINFYYHLILNANEESLMPYHKHSNELWPLGTWSHLWFAGVHECPLRCSIVGAIVTVHQFFCILPIYMLAAISKIRH